MPERVPRYAFDSRFLARLFLDFNPVRKVKFFREVNIGFRVVSLEDEEKLLRNASPYTQDLVRFALNTGLRIGELFDLRWSNVDLEKDVLNVFARMWLNWARRKRRDEARGRIDGRD